MTVPNQFANVTTTIPLSQLDANFNTPITLGNTAIQLGNVVTTLNNMVFANVTITSVSTPITAAQGGTGLSTLASNNVLLGNGTGTVQVVAPGSAGNVLTSTGTTWTSNAASSLAVTSFSAGTTGFTPNSATQGAVTLAGTLATTNGGTGLTSFTANGVVYASSTSALATGSAFTFDGSSAVISVNSATDALRITQVGAGNALVVEDSANPDSTPFVVNASGQVLVGLSTTLPGSANGSISILSEGSSAPNGNINGRRYSNDTTGLTWGSGKARGTFASPTIVQSGDSIGTYAWTAYDGTTFLTAAQITAEVDGTPGTNDMPARLVFSTTADGASGPTERMRIDSAGRVGIGAVPDTNTTLNVGGTFLSSGGNTLAITANGTIASSSTSNAQIFRSFPNTQAASFNLADLRHFFSAQGTIGAGSTITSQSGFFAAQSLTGATNNYGFYSDIASGTGRWNFYANGTAANVFAGTTSIGGLEGAESLRVTPVASPVNYLTVRGGQTGIGPISEATGSDTNIDWFASSKGAGAIRFYTNSFLTGTGIEQFRVAHTASAVNHVQVTGAATGGIPTFSSQGSDSNIGMQFTSKGTGVYRFVTSTGDNGVIRVERASATTSYLDIIANNGVTNIRTGGAYGIQFETNGSVLQFNVAHTASAVNYVQATGSATGAAPTLSSQGSDTNINLRLTAKGTGDVLVTVGALGYGTGTGGAVTQATSRTTGVTLDKSNGAITLVSAAGTTTWQTFTVTNNKVVATDTIIVNQKSGTDLYEIHVTAVAAGSFNISFKTTGGTTTEQPVFNFAVIKAVVA